MGWGLAGSRYLPWRHRQGGKKLSEKETSGPCCSQALLGGSLLGTIPGSWWEAGHASQVGFGLLGHTLYLTYLTSSYSSHAFSPPPAGVGTRIRARSRLLCSPPRCDERQILGFSPGREISSGESQGRGQHNSRP